MAKELKRETLFRDPRKLYTQNIRQLYLLFFKSEQRF